MFFNLKISDVSKITQYSQACMQRRCLARGNNFCSDFLQFDLEMSELSDRLDKLQVVTDYEVYCVQVGCYKAYCSFLNRSAYNAAEKLDLKRKAIDQIFSDSSKAILSDYFEMRF